MTIFYIRLCQVREQVICRNAELFNHYTARVSLHCSNLIAWETPVVYDLVALKVSIRETRRNTDRW